MGKPAQVPGREGVVVSQWWLVVDHSNHFPDLGGDVLEVPTRSATRSAPVMKLEQRTEGGDFGNV